MVPRVTSVPGVALYLALAITCLLIHANVSMAVPKPVNIAIVHQENKAGRLLKKSIEDAISERGLGCDAPNAQKARYCIGDISIKSYSEDIDGAVALKKLINDGWVDIILGPSTSGAFVGLVDQRSEVKNSTPVISPLVTTKVGNDPGTQFFRINVNANRRAVEIYKALNGYPLSAISLLYADSEFGRIAEDAFRNNIEQFSSIDYMYLPYNSPYKVNFQLKKILDFQAEAMGVFGHRKDIETLADEVRDKSSWINQYTPLLFTIIDARQVAKAHPWDTDNMHFVSVVGPENLTNEDESKVLDDVMALSYDTVVLVGHVLGGLRAGLSEAQLRKGFRRELESRMRSSDPIKDTLTGLKFSVIDDKYENTGELYVYRSERGVIQEVTKGFWRSTKPFNKVPLLFSVYGLWPFVNVLIVILTAVFISVRDLKKWYEGKIPELFRRAPFRWFLLVNIALVLTIYISLAETGKVRYSNTIMAFVIAFTPSMVLRSVLQEIPWAKSLGIVNIYDSILSWINEKLMMAQYRDKDNSVNIIAYHSSVERMSKLFGRLFANAPTIEMRHEKEEKLRKDLEAETSEIGKRRVYARRLLSSFSWEDLYENRFVPELFKDKDKKKDFMTLITECAMYCGKEKSAADYNKFKNELLVKIQDTDMNSAIEEELKGPTTIKGKWEMVIKKWIMEYGFDEEDLEERGIIPKENTNGSKTPDDKAPEKISGSGGKM